MVLAAGLGRRFAAGGGAGRKVLASLRGRPVLAHVVGCAVQAGLSPIVVVIDPGLAEDPGLDAALAGTAPADVRRVINPRPEAGLGESLAVGLTSLAAVMADDAPAACAVLLGDQPGIDPTVVEAVTTAWVRSGLPARTRYRDGASHPVVLPRDLWADVIASVAGTDRGAGHLLTDRRTVDVDVDALAPSDVDAPSDLRSIEADVDGPP